MLIAIIINILSIAVLFYGLFNQFENPKQKAIYGYVLAAGMIPYLLITGLVMLVQVFIKQNLLFFLLLICIASPFVIGKLVKYKTLKKYTVIQILCFCVSLVLFWINY